MAKIDEAINEAWIEYVYQDVPTHRLYQSVFADGFKKGVEWAQNKENDPDYKKLKEFIIDHVIDYLMDHQYVGDDIIDGWLTDDYVERFEKYMDTL